jgi:hypothetical protein
MTGDEKKKFTEAWSKYDGDFGKDVVYKRLPADFEGPVPTPDVGRAIKLPELESIAIGAHPRKPGSPLAGSMSSLGGRNKDHIAGARNLPGFTIDTLAPVTPKGMRDIDLDEPLNIQKVVMGKDPMNIYSDMDDYVRKQNRLGEVRLPAGEAHEKYAPEFIKNRVKNITNRGPRGSAAAFRRFDDAFKAMPDDMFAVTSPGHYQVHGLYTGPMKMSPVSKDMVARLGGTPSPDVADQVNKLLRTSSFFPPVVPVRKGMKPADVFEKLPTEVKGYLQDLPNADSLADALRKVPPEVLGRNIKDIERVFKVSPLMASGRIGKAIDESLPAYYTAGEDYGTQALAEAIEAKKKLLRSRKSFVDQNFVPVPSASTLAMKGKLDATISRLSAAGVPRHILKRIEDFRDKQLAFLA